MKRVKVSKEAREEEYGRLGGQECTHRTVGGGDRAPKEPPTSDGEGLAAACLAVGEYGGVDALQSALHGLLANLIEDLQSPPSHANKQQSWDKKETNQRKKKAKKTKQRHDRRCLFD